jgi:hypothetical protein
VSKKERFWAILEANIEGNYPCKGDQKYGKTGPNMPYFAHFGPFLPYFGAFYIVLKIGI